MGQQADNDGQEGLSRRGFLRLGAFGGVSLATFGLGGLFSETAEAKASSTLKPVKHLKASSAFIVGEDDFLDDSSLDESINSDLDTPFYSGSLVKPLGMVAAFEKMAVDARAVEAGRMKAEDALTMDSIIRISPRSKELSKHRSFEDELPMREVLEGCGSFSLNDAMHSLAERVAYGKPITRDLSLKESRDLETKFVKEHTRPLAKRLGMDRTVVCTSTGLPTYADDAGTIPTWKNDSSTQRDMMTLVNHILQEHPEHLYMFGIAERKFPNRKKPHKNTVPLLEDSTKGPEDIVQSIPTEGVVGFKTGINALALWQSICLYDLSKSGGEGYMATISLGNLNDTYATEPQRIFNAAKGLVEQRLAMENTAEMSEPV
ncbi:MAG: hypothetical protein ACRBCK_00185 [Alphaproteobacteria bacterium]